MHAHELACLSFALPAHHPRSGARCGFVTPYVKLFIFLIHFDWENFIHGPPSNTHCRGGVNKTDRVLGREFSELCFNALSWFEGAHVHLEAVRRTSSVRFLLSATLAPRNPDIVPDQARKVN